MNEKEEVKFRECLEGVDKVVASSLGHLEGMMGFIHYKDKRWRKTVIVLETTINEVIGNLKWLQGLVDKTECIKKEIKEEN